MIYTMLKTTFRNTEPKLLKYHGQKNFLFDIYKDDLTENYIINDCNSNDDFNHILLCHWIIMSHNRSGSEITLSLTN